MKHIESHSYFTLHNAVYSLREWIAEKIRRDHTVRAKYVSSFSHILNTYDRICTDGQDPFFEGFYDAFCDFTLDASTDVPDIISLEEGVFPCQTHYIRLKVEFLLLSHLIAPQEIPSLKTNNAIKSSTPLCRYFPTWIQEAATIHFTDDAIESWQESSESDCIEKGSFLESFASDFFEKYYELEKSATLFSSQCPICKQLLLEKKAFEMAAFSFK